MFSNTAYDALYQIIGLELHAKFIELITGEVFFKGLVLLIFGVIFFMTLIKFISVHLPGSLVQHHRLPLSRFVKVIACLFLGLAILRVGSNAEVKDFRGNNWSENSYVKGHFASATTSYRVSVVFNLISTTAEELTTLLTRVVDGMFAKGNSQLEAPDFFYKAVMYAGAASIDDPELRDKLQFYTDECFSKVLPSIERDANQSSIDQLFKISNEADKELSNISLDLGNGRKSSCFDVKESVRNSLIEHASEQSGGIPQSLKEKFFGDYFDSTSYWNYTASMHLVNYYLEKNEGHLGIQKGSETPGAAGAIFHTLNRLMSWDGLLGIFGFKDAQGASEVAKRSQEFSEHLARAPHVAGFIKMLLIIIFPWLMFFVVAGRWRVLMAWFWIYLSVLMWTPLWTLLYHIMLGISMSSEVMESFGKLHDGVSLYSAAIINSRLYFMYSIYAWVQLLVATMTTGSVFLFLKPMLGEGSSESKPEFIDSATDGPVGVAAKGAAGALL